MPSQPSAPPATAAPTTLATLPPELLLQILTHAPSPPQTLAALTRVNPTLHAKLNRELYAREVLSFPSRCLSFFTSTSQPSQPGTLRYWLEAGGDVNAPVCTVWLPQRGGEAVVPLCAAAACGNLAAVKILLEYGADIDGESESDEGYGRKGKGRKMGERQQSWPPLFYALWERCDTVALLLLERGCEKNIVDWEGRNALHVHCGRVYRNDADQRVLKALLSLPSPKGSPEGPSSSTFSATTAGFFDLSLNPFASPIAPARAAIPLPDPRKPRNPLPAIINARDCNGRTPLHLLYSIILRPPMGFPPHLSAFSSILTDAGADGSLCDHDGVSARECEDGWWGAIIGGRGRGIGGGGGGGGGGNGGQFEDGGGDAAPGQGFGQQFVFGDGGGGGGAAVGGAGGGAGGGSGGGPPGGGGSTGWLTEAQLALHERIMREGREGGGEGGGGGGSAGGGSAGGD